LYFFPQTTRKSAEKNYVETWRERVREIWQEKRVKCRGRNRERERR
jgi:hypothetical protein